MVTVLVVEDESLIRASLVLHLEEEGVEVFEAADARQAIALMERHANIQLLFTDLNMPGSMDGLMLTAYVRDRWPPVKIIMTSGRQRLEITDLPDGSLFFAKPYQLASVTHAMREQLSD